MQLLKYWAQNNNIFFFPYRNFIPALHEFYSNLKKVHWCRVSEPWLAASYWISGRHYIGLGCSPWIISTLHSHNFFQLLIINLVSTEHLLNALSTSHLLNNNYSSSSSSSSSSIAGQQCQYSTEYIEHNFTELFLLGTGCGTITYLSDTWLLLEWQLTRNATGLEWQATSRARTVRT